MEFNARHTEETPASHEGRTLAGLCLAMLLASLGTSSASVALPAIAAAFAVEFQSAQWIMLGYLLSITTFIVSAGRLGDIYGRQRLLGMGLAIFSIATLACALSPNLLSLVTARGFQGVGAAFMMSLSLAVISDAVVPSRIGRAMGLLGTMSAVGTALGPSLGGMLLASVGWRGIFWVNLPLGALAWFLVTSVKSEPHGQGVRSGRFDLIGTIVLGMTLACYCLAMTVGKGAFHIPQGIMLLAAAAGVWLFILVEANAAMPLVKLDLLRNSLLCAQLVITNLVATVVMATLVVGPFYLSRAMGYSSMAVGLIMTLGPLTAALAGIPAGRMTDRIGATRATTRGLVGAALGCGLLAFLPVQLGLLAYCIPLMVLTSGYSLFQTANNSAVMRGVKAGEKGSISGILNLSRNLGLITGVAAMGMVFSLAAGGDVSRATPAAVTSGMRQTYLVATALILVAVLIDGFGKRKRTG